MADIKMINNYNIKDETARNEIEEIKAQIPAEAIATEQYVNNAIAGVDLSEHYTKEETDALLIKKANASHNHNTLYYTESEVDSMFNALALDQYATYKWIEDWTKLTYAPIKHTHENYTTKEELNDAIGDINAILDSILGGGDIDDNSR